ILNKGSRPHILVMSATPIPRSLAMSLYSDLDVSVIKGLPGGRKPVKTALRSDAKRTAIYKFIRDELAKGGQAYIVYRITEESEKVDIKNATAGFENIKKQFQTYKGRLLHGRMKPEEKEAVMHRFIENKVKILVSTTVI